tara:strand:- start:131 stop:394 length:264 start_codon:yes stop_codon:yes gene_type:complete
MLDRPTPADLARRYLDLWDRQARAMAGDPNWAAVIQRWIAELGNTAETDGKDHEGTETGATAAAAAPAGGNDHGNERDGLSTGSPRR